MTLSPAITTTYYLRAESATAAPCAANVAAAGSITVIVNQPSVVPTSLNSSPNTICNGSSTTLTQTGGSLGTGASWKWYSDASFTTLIGTSAVANASLSVSPTATTTYYLRAESATGTPCTANVAAPGSLIITVNDPVAISAQPATTQTVCSGTNASFSVTATGTGLTYQWRKGTTNLVNGGNISGATSATLTISNVATVDAANNYNVIITGTSPCTPATSNNAILQVNKKVVIGTQPSNIGICASSPAQFGVVASGDNLTYQWYKGTFPGTAVTNTAFITGAQTNILNFSQAFLADDGIYYVVISGASPCASVKSNEVTLNVDQSISITTQPVSQSLCIGSNVTFAVTANANGDPMSYQWRKNGSIINGQTASSLTLNAISLTDNANYDVLISGSVTYTCPSVQSNVISLTVYDNSTISLSSAAGTNIQTKCINTAITTITYAIGGGGTGASITAGGLPSGVTGAYSSGTFTISGTPTVAGTFPYTITTSGPCVNPALSGTITVNPNSTISLSSTAGTNIQTKCINTAITTITYAIGGGGTGASITAGGLPSGVTGTYNSGTFTISGTPTVAGTFPYTMTTSGSCVNPALSGTITVNPDSTISLSSAAGTNIQTKCINTAITTITYAIGGGGTGASITAGGLPSGVTGAYNSGTFTISGTPTVAGTFPYTVTTSGPCVNPALSGTITVSPNSTISLSSAAGTNIQTKCINTAITTITYTIGGGGTGASITAGSLPTGVTGAYSSGTFTISGTPTVAGTFPYTITTSGPCVNPALSGTITVSPDSTISLSSAAGTNIQTKCINTAITTITYTIGGGGTGASITAGSLPSGVTGTYNSGTFTISGTPTVAGTFPYTVTTSGSCVNPALSGTITVSPNSTISLSSTAGTNIQTKCINTAITTITYAIGGGGTGVSITTGSLPSGVTGTYNSGTFAISGTPTVAGTFPYTVTTSGSCVNPALSGTITVNPDSTISLSSAAGTNIQTKCINTAITTITYTIGGGGTGTSITAGSLPTGVTGAYSSGTFTISGTPTVAGTFPYTVTTSGPCVNTALSGTITVDGISVGGNLTGYSTDQAGNPYNNPIVYSTNLIACLSTNGLLVLNGYIGNIIRWEYSVNGGVNWTTVSNTTNSNPYSNIQETRIYRAVIQNGSCGIAYSNIVSISVVPQDIKPTPVTASKTTMCLGETTVFNATSGFATGQTITGGDFNQGQLNTQDPNGWLVNGSPGGWTANGDNTKPSIDWSGTNGPKTFAGITYDTSDNSKFGIVFGIVTSKLETPVFNTFGLTTAKLEFYQAYFLGAGSNIKVGLSTNGGSTYPISLQNITGSASSGGFIGLNYTSIDLQNYIGQTQLRVSFTFIGANTNSAWALDNFKLPDAPPNQTIEWTDEDGNIIATINHP